MKFSLKFILIDTILQKNSSFFSMNYNDNQTTNGLIWKNKKNDETTWGLCLKSSSEIPFDLI